MLPIHPGNVECGRGAAMILRPGVSFTEVSLMPLVTQKDKGYLRPLTYQLQRQS